MTFPAEAIPDGALLAPHHFIYGCWAALLTLSVLWNDLKRREPIVVAVLICVALFGWYHIWQWYPVTGAVLTFVAPLVAITWILTGYFFLDEMTVWNEYPPIFSIMVIFWLLVALDDVVSHAFGVPTPLDFIWIEFIAEHIQ